MCESSQPSRINLWLRDVSQCPRVDRGPYGRILREPSQPALWQLLHHSKKRQQKRRGSVPMAGTTEDFQKLVWPGVLGSDDPEVLSPYGIPQPACSMYCSPTLSLCLVFKYCKKPTHTDAYFTHTITCSPGQASLLAQTVKNLPAMWETRVQSLGWENPLEKAMATQFSILAWWVPWTEAPGRLKSMDLERVGHDWATNTHILARPYSMFVRTGLKVKRWTNCFNA